MSILIPTYNRPEYLEEALQSALAQTYENIEILICDNSEDGRTQLMVDYYQTVLGPSRIKYIKNDTNIGPAANQLKCCTLASGEYINYLMDDDLLHPEKIKRMAHYLNTRSEVSLVTSRKKIIDSDGKLVRLSPRKIPFAVPDGEAAFIKGQSAIEALLQTRHNYIGEPTTVLFRKSSLQEPFGSFCGSRALNNVDVATWLSLLASGDMVYIGEPLSSFRKHPNQISKSTLSKMAELCDWIDHTVQARKRGLFQDEARWRKTLLRLSREAAEYFPKWNKKTNYMFNEELMSRAKLLAGFCREEKELQEAFDSLNRLHSRRVGPR
ncbi:glycosyltransferase [Paenibacillus pinistramenti]|uniref:glycosyltransferase n=1 Tax=Paenibacillus pinistramenti TaxID=1768003 RepID=UPI00139681EF|nr:glycosyltransferase [Paenibacillus pinistramenti]